MLESPNPIFGFLYICQKINRSTYALFASITPDAVTVLLPIRTGLALSKKSLRSPKPVPHEHRLEELHFSLVLIFAVEPALRWPGFELLAWMP